LALGGDGRREQGFLVAEVAVDGELGHAGGAGDLVHAHALIALLQEQSFGRLEDRLPLAEVLRPAGAARARGRDGRGSGGLAGHAAILDQVVFYLYHTAEFIIPPSESVMRNGSRRCACWALAVTAVMLLASCGGDGPAPEAARPVWVVRPQPADGTQLLAFPGEVHAREESPLAFRVGGKLVRRHVDPGDRVREGQLLAELDPGDQEAQVRAAQAQLAAAEAELERARGDL